MSKLAGSPVDGEVEHGEGAEGDDAGDDEARQVDVVEGVVLVDAHRRRPELDDALVEQRRVGVLHLIGKKGRYRALSRQQQIVLLFRDYPLLT